MNPFKIVAIQACVCILTGGWMILDSLFFCLHRVTHRLIAAHELAERFTKLPGGEELEKFSKAPGEEGFSEILHNLAYGDRTLYIIIGCILVIAGTLGLLSLRWGRPNSSRQGLSEQVAPPNP